MKKFILLFPPCWNTFGPHLALPLLRAQLKAAHFTSEVIDLNIDFYTNMYTKTAVKALLKKIQENYNNFYQNLNKNKINKSDKYIEFLVERYKNIELFLGNRAGIVDLTENIENAINILRDSKRYYCYKDLRKATKIIDKVNWLMTIAYSETCFTPYENIFNYENIKEIVFDEDLNIFNSYFNSKINEIITKNPDFIGISIATTNQLIPALTFAYKLKKASNAHINIGGNFITKIKNDIKILDFFETFVDSISYGEGDISIVELAKYINNEITIDSVHNLIYRKDDKFVVNPYSHLPKLSNIAQPDYSDIDFSKYIFPKAILPLTMNRGCYWNKCSFCDVGYSSTFSVKKIDDLINEIKFYIKEYNITYFTIIDGCVLPEYFEKFCDAVIKNNIKINFDMCLRLEKKFNYNLLKKAYCAGLRVILWGVESGSKKILNLINKGIDIKNAPRILKDSNKAGILNFTFFIYGIPTETYQDILKSLSFISKNKKNIYCSLWAEFALPKCSIMSENPENYGISINEIQETLSPCLKYTAESISQSEREIFFDKLTSFQKKHNKEELILKFGLYNFFLYNVFYGKEFILEKTKYKKKLHNKFLCKIKHFIK